MSNSSQLPSNHSAEWESICPTVNAEAEFLEIVHDFGNPLELLREAISNSIDWGSTEIKIGFNMQDVEGNPRLVITIADNGVGMTHDILANDFWGLGYSKSREIKLTEGKRMIGEKSHGTKIYLRSDKVIVRTQSSTGCYLSECEKPLAALSNGKLHQPKVKAIPHFRENNGTEITIIGYNDNQLGKFTQRVVKDYLQWFTKAGSIEKMFGILEHDNFKISLKALDVDNYEEISFGHIFPDENSDIEKLFDEMKDVNAADHYVKRHIYKNLRLQNNPHVTFDAIISVEGDQAKRSYNEMIRDRSRSDSGSYKVSDRYGIWLCKDYIPITRVNHWISGFGTGSNAINILVHGFVNCQSLKLTANRSEVANTDTKILDELQATVSKLVAEIDIQLLQNGLYILRDWQREEMTLQQERADYTRRVKELKGRRTTKFEDRLLIEPKSEAELFGIFMVIYTLHPELFEFEPLDYNTNRGIDIIGRNKSSNVITEGEHSYIELKLVLDKKRFNHAYQHLRWILCWDFANDIIDTYAFLGVDDNDSRRLQMDKDDDGHNIYFLDSKRKSAKVQVIRFKEFLRDRLKIEFK